MLSNKKVVFVIILVCICFVAILLALIFKASNTPSADLNATKTVIIDNESSYSSGINGSVFTGLGNAAYSVTSLNVKNVKNVYHGVIRSGSFKSSSTNIFFILDIPSLKISWAMNQALGSGGAPQSDASALCVTSKQAIYPLLAGCMDQSTGFQTPAQTQFLQITSDLPLNGPTYSVTYTTSLDSASGYTLVITYYTSSGKQDALNAIQALGYTPSDYPINYVDGTQ